MRSNFIHINEGFICEHCKKENPHAEGSCRNHCKYCLFSKHVDKDVPGDRLSSCNGHMAPIEIDHNAKKGYVIIHKCSLCSIEKRNKMATDDDFEAVIRLSKTKIYE